MANFQDIQQQLLDDQAITPEHKEPKRSARFKEVKSQLLKLKEEGRLGEVKFPNTTESTTKSKAPVRSERFQEVKEQLLTRRDVTIPVQQQAQMLGLEIPEEQIETGTPEFKEVIRGITEEPENVSFGERVGEVTTEFEQEVIQPVMSGLSTVFGGEQIGRALAIQIARSAPEIANALGGEGTAEKVGELEIDKSELAADAASIALMFNPAKIAGLVGKIPGISKLPGILKKIAAGATVGGIEGERFGEGEAGAALGAILPIGGAAIGGVLKGVSFSPFGKLVDEGVTKLASERGIELPAAAKTKSKTVQQIQAFFGSTKFQESIGKAKNQLSENFEKLSKKIPDESIRKAGESIKTGFNKFKKDFRTKSQELYGAVPNTIKEIESSTSNTVQALQEIQERAAESLTTREGQSRFKVILDNILGDSLDEGQKKSFSLLFKDEIPGKNTIPYKSLLQTRKDIGKMLESRTDPVSTGLKSELEKVYAALSNDLNITLKTADPAAFKATQEANKFFRDQINKINSIVGKKIKNTEASQLLGALVKKNSPDAIKLTKDLVGGEGVEHLQSTFVSDVLKNSINKNTGFLDAGKIDTQIKKFGRETIEELLTPEQLKNLDNISSEAANLTRIQKAISRGESVTQGSQTMFGNKITALLTAGGLSFVDPKVMAGLAAMVLSERLGGKFFNSKTGQKLLGKGFNVEFGKTGKKIGEKISSVDFSKTPASKVIPAIVKPEEN